MNHYLGIVFLINSFFSIFGYAEWSSYFDTDEIKGVNIAFARGKLYTLDSKGNVWEEQTKIDSYENAVQIVSIDDNLFKVNKVGSIYKFDHDVAKKWMQWNTKRDLKFDLDAIKIAGNRQHIYKIAVKPKFGEGGTRIHGGRILRSESDKIEAPWTEIDDASNTIDIALMDGKLFKLSNDGEVFEFHESESSWHPLSKDNLKFKKIFSAHDELFGLTPEKLYLWTGTWKEVSDGGDVADLAFSGDAFYQVSAKDGRVLKDDGAFSKEVRSIKLGLLKDIRKNRPRHKKHHAGSRAVLRTEGMQPVQDEPSAPSSTPPTAQQPAPSKPPVGGKAMFPAGFDPSKFQLGKKKKDDGKS